MKKISFFNHGWDDYLYWQQQDKKTLKKINDLIKSILRDGPLSGIGKPEALKGSLTGVYSREINKKDRLLYTIDEDEICILQCRNHYSDT